VRHELRLLARQVGRKVLGEIGRIKKDKVIGCLGQRSAAVGKLLAVAGFGLACLRRMRSDVDEPGNVRIRAGLGDNGATVAMAYQDAWAVLRFRMRLTAATSPSSEVSGCWTPLTRKPSLIRRL
jgi:hypothetical protein